MIDLMSQPENHGALGVIAFDESGDRKAADGKLGVGIKGTVRQF